MFEISKNLSINLEVFRDSKIYTIDNFYQDPYSVVNYFLSIVPPLWKIDSPNTVNGIHFEDRRHMFDSEEIEKVYDFLSFICDREPYKVHVCTNVSRFKKNKFNNYENNYWWPHKDHGYTGIVYFNTDDEVNGTNLYECLDENYVVRAEHECPWVSKKKFGLIKTLRPRFNRLVLFDAKKFIHGMNISNDTYFDEGYRFNQAFFFS
jgi:hypothetical protein|tara:strand:+ start:82 stop:699 length:618 start_codon:yes stop_codon:yes gene_type:complete